MKALKWTYWIVGTLVFLWWVGTLIEPGSGSLSFLSRLPPLPNWLVFALIVFEVGLLGHQFWRRRREQQRTAPATASD